MSSLKDYEDPTSRDEEGSDDKKIVMSSRTADVFTHSESMDDKADKFPMRKTDIALGNKHLRFNYFASILGIAILWGLSIWCIVEPDKALAEMVSWKAELTAKFTWLFIGTKPIFTFFVIFLAIRFRNVKLGPQDSKPEFSNVTYFCMMFSSGIENGLFFFGVAEPLWHQSTNWFTQQGKSQDEIDQFAMNQTLFHWGLPGWSQYILVAICAGLASFKFNLPLTYRSCFYPLLGDYTWGWIGDVIDGFAIVTTIAGVCTSLGLGILQIVDGMKYLDVMDLDASTDDEVRAAVIVIWVITAISVCSLLTGIHKGIKYLSQIGFSLANLLLFLVLVMDKTSFIFNLLVQSIGYYLQWSLILTNFWTDAFGQLNEGEGRAVDGLAAEQWWMDAWTVFYWAWWTAWSGFVGMFLARISRGRTIAEVVSYGFGGALLYTIIWFVVFGGVGLRQSRQALEIQELGATYYNNSQQFVTDDFSYCYNVPDDLVIDGEVVFSNSLPYVSPVCTFNEDESGFAWYHVMSSFEGLGQFLSWLSIAALVIYFVTSSDSASLMVDHFASNGHEGHHWIQRAFWGLTEGAVCTGLMVAGQADALLALQSAAVIAGLPFTFFLCFQAYTTWIMCNAAETGDDPASKYHSPEAVLEDKLSRQFKMPVYGGILNIFEFIISFGMVHRAREEACMGAPSTFQFVEFFKALFMPFLSMHRICSLLDHGCYTTIISAVYGVCFFAWIALFIGVTENWNLIAFGWSAFFISAGILTGVRGNVRAHFGFDGNVLEDFVACSFFYPQTLVQMLFEFEAVGYSDESPDKKLSEDSNEVEEVAAA